MLVGEMLQQQSQRAFGIGAALLLGLPWCQQRKCRDGPAVGGQEK